MPLYFSYGSNLDPDQMRRRCSSSQTVGAAVIRGYLLTFPRRSQRWGGGVAGVEPDEGSVVHVAVYRLSDIDLKRLDGFEGVNEGRYRREEVEVAMADGGTESVTLYVASPEPGGPFKPSSDYLAAIIRGARHHSLPSLYVTHMSGLDSA